MPETLDRIEHAVEGFKKQALPELERSLLQRAQQRFADEGGKRDLPLLRLNNGKDRLRIRTLHRSFEFPEQRFVLPDESACRYLIS